MFASRQQNRRTVRKRVLEESIGAHEMRLLAVNQKRGRTNRADSVQRKLADSLVILEQRSVLDEADERLAIAGQTARRAVKLGRIQTGLKQVIDVGALVLRHREADLLELFHPISPAFPTLVLALFNQRGETGLQ